MLRFLMGMGDKVVAAGLTTPSPRKLIPETSA
jgi:hypothetical protein